MFEKCDSSTRKKCMVASFRISARFTAKIGFCLNTERRFFVEGSDSLKISVFHLSDTTFTEAHCVMIETMPKVTKPSRS